MVLERHNIITAHARYGIIVPISRQPPYPRPREWKRLPVTPPLAVECTKRALVWTCGRDAVGESRGHVIFTVHDALAFAACLKSAIVRHTAS